MIRSLIERYARGKSIRRRLPQRFGKRSVYLSPDSALSYLKRNWADGSSDLLAAARKYVSNQSNVWDIGGTVGVFTFASAHEAGPDAEIVSVEADPFLASLLQRSACHGDNRDRNVAVVCAAVSDRTGIARFMIANRGRSSNSLEQSGHRTQAGGTRYVQHVPTLTLDSMLKTFKAPQIMKIDVEGAEAMVLEGGTRVLTESRPIIYVEVGRDQNESVASILKTKDYRLFNGDVSDGVEIQKCAFNTLAVPSELDLTNKGITIESLTSRCW
ncbi:MAG: FkbM family methyltransferase [Fuerstiella sp.]